MERESQREEFVSVIPTLFMACGVGSCVAWWRWDGGCGGRLIGRTVCGVLGPGVWFDAGWGQGLGEGVGMGC